MVGLWPALPHLNVSINRPRLTSRHPGPKGTKLTITVTLPDEEAAPNQPKKAKGGDDDEPEGRRFKVVLKHVASIDLDSLRAFCNGERQSTQAESMMVSRVRSWEHSVRVVDADETTSQLTALMSVNVLLRDEVSAPCRFPAQVNTN
jgi:hypothetical protein